MQSHSQDSVLDKDITFEVLASLFHLPLSTAALQLGVCCTALKKKCRKNGISRWPYRTLQSIDKMISAIENAPQNERASIELEYLKSKRDVIMRKPSATTSAKSATPSVQPATKTIKKPSQAKFATGVVNRQMLAQANPLDILQEAAKYSEYSAPQQKPQSLHHQHQAPQQALAPMPNTLSRTDQTKFIPMGNPRLGTQSQHPQAQPPYIMPSPGMDVKPGQKMGSRYMMVPSMSSPPAFNPHMQIAAKAAFGVRQGHPQQASQQLHQQQAQAPQQQFVPYMNNRSSSYANIQSSAPQHLQQVPHVSHPAATVQQMSKASSGSFVSFEGARKSSDLPYAPPVHRAPSPPGSSPPHNPAPSPVPAQAQGWNFELPQLRIPESASNCTLPKLRTLEPSNFPMSNHTTPLTIA